MRRFGVIAVVIGVLGSSLATNSLAAAGEGIGTSFANPCPVGSTRLMPVGVVENSDGSAAVGYLIGGIRNEVRIPPRNFMPLAASDSDLEFYGLPPRPTDATALSAWMTDMASWRRNTDAGLCQSNASASPTSSVNASSASRSGASAGTFNTPIWSGYMPKVSTATYIAVQGDFYQPSKGSSSCTGDSLGSWTGIGGFGTNSLIQTGTVYLVNTSTPAAFYEYISPSHDSHVIPMSGVTVHSGDRVHTYVVHQTSGAGQTTFYVADNTTGTSESDIVNLDSSYYDGTSAEWIDERLSYNNVPTPLVNFNQNSWYNAQAETTSGTWHTLGSQFPNELDMYTSTYLAFPLGLNTNTTFYDDYWACQ